jgi:carboxypeptidase T
VRVVKGRPILILVAVAVVALLSVPGAAVARSGATKAGAQIQTVSTYRVEGVSDKFQRTAIARTGADIVFVDGSSVIIRANQRNLSAIQALGYATTAVQLGDNFPPEDARYHNYDEMVTDINAVEAAHPDIVDVFSIGKSYENRDIWAAKVSDNVAVDESEPESLFDGMHHAREHLTVEMTMSILHLLADNYGHINKITNLVNNREVYIVFDLNPDGGEYDILNEFYHYWRKNRQPTPNPNYIGTDLNRNYDYKWGCCGGSSGFEGDETYRGPSPESTPEVAAYAAFVESRVIGGKQQITTSISFHTYGQLVMWPYGYTFTNIPPDMDPTDYEVFTTMGTAMANRTCQQGDCYTPQQSSDLYITDGSNLDWMYGSQRIIAFTIEMYPSCCDFYVPDEVIRQQTNRMRGVIAYLLDHADCPREVIQQSCS